MRNYRDVAYITAVLPKEKAAYIIERGEQMCVATGQLFSQSNTMNMIVDHWLKLGAPSLGPGDMPTPVPPFNVRLRYARRPKVPKEVAIVEEAAAKAAQLRSKAKQFRPTVSQS